MNQQPTPGQFRMRFGIGTLLLTMLVISVAAAAASYMVNANSDDGWPRLVFILFTLSAPVVLLVIMSLAHVALKWLNRR